MENINMLERYLVEDDTAKLVFDVVENVLETNELDWFDCLPTPVTYTKWSTNDGTSRDSTQNNTGRAHFVCRPLKNNCDFWSKYSGDVKHTFHFNFSRHEQLQSQSQFKEREQSVEDVKEVLFGNLLRAPKKRICTFCRKNGESLVFCSTHSLYKDGKISCPVLQQCKCNICGQKGHTMSHCHKNGTRTSILKMIHRCNSMTGN